MVVAVTAAVLVVLPGSTKSASAVVVGSVNTALADRTAHLAMSMKGTASGVSFTETGSGAVDFTHGAAQLNLDVASGGQSVSLPVIYQGGSIYEQVPGLDTLMAGKSWVSLDISAQQADANEPGVLSSGDNPFAMVRLYAQRGNTVVALGKSTVDGVGVTGYSVTVDPSTLRSDLAGVSLPAWMRQAISTVNIQQVVGDLYIDHSGALRRYISRITLSTTSGGTIALVETIDLSDFGTPVDISAPSPDQVTSIQQFIKAAEAAAQQQTDNGSTLAIPGASGYLTYAGPAGLSLAEGQPWGNRCQPILFDVSSHVPDVMYNAFAATVRQARADGADVAVETRQFSWDPSLLYPSGQTLNSVKVVDIFASTSTPPVLSNGHLERFRFDWNADTATSGQHEYVTFLQATMFVSQVGGSVDKTQIASRSIIAFAQGVAGTDLPVSGLAETTPVSEFTPADLNAMQLMSGCDFQTAPAVP